MCVCVCVCVCFKSCLKLVGKGILKPFLLLVRHSLHGLLHFLIWARCVPLSLAHTRTCIQTTVRNTHSTSALLTGVLWPRTVVANYTRFPMKKTNIAAAEPFMCLDPNNYEIKYAFCLFKNKGLFYKKYSPKSIHSRFSTRKIVGQ